MTTAERVEASDSVLSFSGSGRGRQGTTEAEDALKDVFKGKRPDDIKKVSVTSTFSDLDPDSGRVLPISKRP